MTISAIASLVVLFVAGSAVSQQPKDELIDQLNSELDQLSKDVAEEYVDILENIGDVLKDYSTYVKEMPADAADHDIKIIAVMQDNLRRGAYADNPEKLLDDLYAAIDSIKAVENEHRVKFNTNSPSCCRIGRSLRKELVIKAELVEDCLDKQSGKVLQKDQIKKYVNEAMKALQEIDQAKGTQGQRTAEVERAIEALRALGLAGRVVWIPEATKAPKLPELPELPEAPEIEPPTPPSVVWTYG